MLRTMIVLFMTLWVSFAAKAEETTMLVKLVTVSPSETKVTRQFFGHVAARETVDLAFQVGGQIVEIPIVEGEVVEEGQVIARLDLEPFELALDQARVQKEQADRTLDRLQRLQGSTVSQVAVDDAETQAKLAEISVRDAERSLRDAQLLAPFDALVASRSVANFSTISAGTPVARIHDMSELRVEIDVPEILFQRAGRDPDIDLWAKFPTSETQYPLEPREFNAETSQIGQTFRITLAMEPPEDIVVLPGSSVTVFASLNGQTSSLRIPSSAVVTTNDGTPQVMLFMSDNGEEGTVKAVPVSIAPSANGAVDVVEGLELGQEIVASGANQLSDGARVKRFTGFSN